jgi:hypothetical protein
MKIALVVLAVERFGLDLNNLGRKMSNYHFIEIVILQ